MEVHETKLIKTQNKIQTVDFIYFGVLIIFLIIVIISFFSSTNFILNNINKIFSQNTEVDSRALDIPNYKLLEKKLNLPINNLNEILDDAPIVVEETVATLPEPEILMTAKELLTINIINSTTKKGAAADLSKILVAQDYPTATTASQKNIAPITSVSLKISTMGYANDIVELVKKSYKNVEILPLDENSKFNVEIIIGK